jgi:hypothetical protein
VSIVAEPIATAEGDGTTEAAGDADGETDACGDAAGFGGMLVAGAPMVAVGGAGGVGEQAAATVTSSPRAVDKKRGI